MIKLFNTLRRRHSTSDSRGMSLVEVIVACAIFGIVSAILLGFMVTSSNTHQSISGEIALQMQSQIAITQIKEYIIDANAFVFFDSATGTLTITDKDASGNTLSTHIFAHVGDIITYNGNELAKNITHFDISYTDLQRGTARTVNSISISIILERSGKTYSANQIVALRNETVSWALATP
jgi:prepilin-type N-terminal cleavage/methylation domain